jgi:predicted ribosome quality control (RQC) complex YloA/Tae2 family protein
MYLSDLVQVSEYTNNNASGAIISGFYRSYGGTVIKLYGKSISGIYFNLKEKVLFPVSDMSRFKKEPLTRLEEGLRANVSGRINGVFALIEYGKVVKIELFDCSLIIPLFRNKTVRIINNDGSVKWMGRNEEPLELLEIPMKEFPVQSDDPFFYELDFIDKIREKEEIEQQKIIEKKRVKLISGIEILHKRIADHVADIEKYSTYASLIKANLFSMNPAQKKESVKLTDFSGSEIIIELDPAKTVAENMNRFFIKVKKAKSGVAHTEKRIEVAKAELENIENTYKKPTVQKKRTQNVHKPYHEFRSSGGSVFLVGKEAKDNDELTFKISSPHDIWFHAKDYHGSHVILKMKKGDLPKSDDILNGCILAILYSKAKKGLSGEVWFTERKNVTKKKGMPAGTVLFKNGRSKYISNAIIPENLIKTER